MKENAEGNRVACNKRKIEIELVRQLQRQAPLRSGSAVSRATADQSSSNCSFSFSTAGSTVSLSMSIFQKLEVHGLCELSVLESRRVLLYHLGASSLSLLLVLGCISFKAHFMLTTVLIYVCAKRPRTYLTSAISCSVLY